MRYQFNYVSWGAVGATALLWVLFGWLASELMNARAGFAEAQVSLAQMAQQENESSRLRGLLRDTDGARTELDAMVKTDVLTEVDTIEKTGAKSGVIVRVESATQTSLSNPKSSKELHAFLILVTAHGKLPALLREAAILESLPFPATLDGVDFEQLPGAQTGADANTWQLSGRVRVITTSTIGV